MTQAADNTVPLRVLFALPGLHKVHRGAERAFESIAIELSRLGQHVTLIGSGRAMRHRPYSFIHAACIPRDCFVHFPKLPYLRTHYAYEELSFAPFLRMKFNPADYDVTVTCGFPYTNRVLRDRHGTPHIFVTQNGDHMLSAPQIDYRSFACDGLVCTNPVIYERHRNRWPSALILNGVDVQEFSPSQTNRPRGEPPTALMVSALTPSKRVIEGIRAAAAVKDLKMVIAGTGEIMALVQRTGRDLMPDRFHLHPHPPDEMPEVYRDADVFLHMSQDEPSSVAYLEALATGLPVVAHDSPVTRWTFEETAYLVYTNDPSAVTAALRRAIETNSAQKIAARRELAERRFAWPMIARRYLDFFRQVKNSC